MRCDTAEGVTNSALRRALEAAFPDDGGQCGERGVVQHDQFYFIEISELVCLHAVRAGKLAAMEPSATAGRSRSSCKAWP
jgi:hypothetical protein